MSGYNIYSGLSAEDLALVDTVPAGVGEFTVAQANSTVRYYKITAVTAAGLESDGAATIRVEKLADGTIITDRPNALLDARPAAAVGGTVTVTARYSRTGEPAAARATGVQVARVLLGDGAGDGDWANALGVMTLDGRGTAHETFDDVFDDGSTVRLAARATTGGAAPIYGDTFILAPVVADQTAPEEVSIVEAGQA